MAGFILRIIEHVPVEDSYSPSGSHSNGSIGMLFVVLVVIIVLGLLAGVVARICGGRHFAGNIEYDFEGWVERTCASCIDGSMPPTGGGSHTLPKLESEGADAAAAKQAKIKGGDADALKPADGKGGEKKRGGNGSNGNKGGGKKGKGPAAKEARNRDGEGQEEEAGPAEDGDKGDGQEGEISGEKKEGEGGS
eukprot:c25180_g1_i1 orf=588-1166(+)